MVPYSSGLHAIAKQQSRPSEYAWYPPLHYGYHIQNSITENMDMISVTTNSQYTAVIIEPRQHKALEFVLKNYTSFLDDRWNFVICHGTDNEDFVKNIVKTSLSQEAYRIIFVNLHVSNLTIEEYNALLMNKSFYDNISTEIFLIFQTDSMICEKNKDKIYDFLQYDYVGAPWKDEKVGNGGLSLRRKSKMLEILTKCDSTPSMNEDGFFSDFCDQKVSLHKPSFENAKLFSVETVYSGNSFGVHKAWNYLPLGQIQSMNEYCSGLDELIKLNSYSS